MQDALGTQSLSTLQCRPSVGLLTQQRVKESRYLRTHDKTFLQPGHCLQKNMDTFELGFKRTCMIVVLSLLEVRVTTTTRLRSLDVC